MPLEIKIVVTEERRDGAKGISYKLSCEGRGTKLEAKGVKAVHHMLMAPAPGKTVDHSLEWQRELPRQK